MHAPRSVNGLPNAADTRKHVRYQPMNTARRLLERFPEQLANAVNRRPRSTQNARSAGGDRVASSPSAATAESVLATLQTLSVKKQVGVYERWPGPQIELADGVTVTARSMKERRRFVRSVDAEVLEWFETFETGDVFYDIGANCGSLTLAAAGMYRERLQIVAIEPGFSNFESLARNLSRNAMLGFVIPLQVALLDRTGLEPINYYGSTAAGTSLHSVGRPVDHEDNAFIPVETQMVLAYALDDLLETQKLPEPTHIKIDVDGVEEALLRGSSRTLARRHVKDLLVEIVDHDRLGTRLSAIRGLLAADGYELAETFSHHVGDERSFVGDYLFRRKA